MPAVHALGERLIFLFAALLPCLHWVAFANVIGVVLAGLLDGAISGVVGHPCATL